MIFKLNLYLSPLCIVNVFILNIGFFTQCFYLIFCRNISYITSYINTFCIPILSTIFPYRRVVSI